MGACHPTLGLSSRCLSPCTQVRELHRVSELASRYGSGVAGVSRLWWPDGKLRMLLPITTASSKTRVRLSFGAPIIYSVKDNWSPTTVEV
jgi:hypothetical protein